MYEVSHTDIAALFAVLVIIVGLVVSKNRTSGSLESETSKPERTYY
ncbi:hypothetical protein SpAn4DRAFT_4507 [Sporomusa ovata]|uniref:Uncharacterized protein n=1 Tax=Sporomusa ovata TaxID=2378 RepID=A0A0U1L7N4_9FIRM|nr:hypothetical protein SpAn4DRAFT_4507 [Sporomusa ovata]